MIEFILENWMTIITAAIAGASVIAKVTPNQTDNTVIARLQKIVDVLALSSKPTEYKKNT